MPNPKTSADAEAIRTTLLELVRSVQDYTESVDETTAEVTELVNSGRAQLTGIFAGTKSVR